MRGLTLVLAAGTLVISSCSRPAAVATRSSLPVPTRGPVSRADSLELSTVIFRTAIEHATRTSYRAPHPRLVCLAAGEQRSADPFPEVIAALQSIDSLVVRPMSACRREPLGSFAASTRTPLVVDTLTGKRGIMISASNPRFADDGTLTVEVGYYEHGLSSAGWTCTGRRQSIGWAITTCRMTRIS